MPNYITTLKMPNDDVYVIKDEAAQTLIESIKNGYFGNLVHQVDANGNVYNFYKKNDNTTVLATITLATTVTSTGDAANNPVTSGAVASAISGTASSSDLTALANRVTTVENNYNALMNNADAEKIINSFNEVVTFLAGVTTDDTLIGKLNELNTNKQDKPMILLDWISNNIGSVPESEGQARALTSEESTAVSSLRQTRYWWVYSTTGKIDVLFSEPNDGELMWTCVANVNNNICSIKYHLHKTSGNLYWLEQSLSTIATADGLSTVATSGSYTDLSDKPVLKTDNSTAQTTSASETITGIINLHKVAKTGTLADLITDNTHQVVTNAEKSTWSGKYSKPSGGIPKTDLANAVQTSLGKADSSVQTLTGSNDTAVAPNSAGNLKVNLTGSYANETLTLSIAVTAPST